MPKTPCAGCSKPIQTSPSSLPAGQLTCQPCRRLGHGPAKRRICPCGKTFRAHDHHDRQQLTCSKSCGQKFRTNRPAHRNPDWRQRKLGAWQRKNLKRRAGQASLILTIVELGDRDGWRCHLCHKRVRRDVSYPHPMSGSRDHLIPVSSGGSNEPANLAFAHLKCNVDRRTGGNVQLLLVG